jgi:hypothetical protein
MHRGTNIPKPNSEFSLNRPSDSTRYSQFFGCSISFMGDTLDAFKHHTQCRSHIYQLFTFIIRNAVAAPSVRYTLDPRNFSISSINNVLQDAGGPPAGSTDELVLTYHASNQFLSNNIINSLDTSLRNHWF